jgi:hypothetical protein
MSKNIADKILHHPDFQEILAKLLNSISPKDIAEGLNLRYQEVESKKFQLSERMIKTFKADYLDFYMTMKNDLTALQAPQTPASQALLDTLNNNIAYKDALTKYANTELDIKQRIAQLCSIIEVRTEQVFNNMQEDVGNMRNDRILIEWVSALTSALHELREANEVSPDAISIQNNISIQVLDTHMDAVFSIIREILTKLDYDTSLAFVDMWHDAMGNLKEKTVEAVPVEQRLEAVNAIATGIKVLPE